MASVLTNVTFYELNVTLDYIDVLFVYMYVFICYHQNVNKKRRKRLLKMSMNHNILDEQITITDFSEIVGISRQQVYRLIKKHEVKQYDNGSLNKRDAFKMGLQFRDKKMLNMNHLSHLFDIRNRLLNNDQGSLSWGFLINSLAYVHNIYNNFSEDTLPEIKDYMSQLILKFFDYVKVISFDLGNEDHQQKLYMKIRSYSTFLYENIDHLFQENQITKETHDQYIKFLDDLYVSGRPNESNLYNFINSSLNIYKSCIATTDDLDNLLSFILHVINHYSNGVRINGLKAGNILFDVVEDTLTLHLYSMKE